MENLTEIARRYFRVKTLEYRNSDSLDFHDISVGQMSDALKAAYEQGAADMRQIYIDQHKGGNPLPEVK